MKDPNVSHKCFETGVWCLAFYEDSCVHFVYYIACKCDHDTYAICTVDTLSPECGILLITILLITLCGLVETARTARSLAGSDK
jgi:hypothetical protein